MKDFSQWLSESANRAGMPRKKERVLTPEAQADRDDFERDDYGCSCHISRPCGYCTHPVNPLNQEDDDCWMEVESE